MAAIKVKKIFLTLSLLTLAFSTHLSAAVGLATGLSLGIGGFRTAFESKQPLQKEVHTDNLALQLGWSAKLDVWLLYTKLDAFFVFYWHKLPSRISRDHFQYISLPFTIGWPLFGLFRPHAGLAFRIPLGKLSDVKLKKEAVTESCKEKINGYILGCGIDLASILIDIYCEFGCRTMDRKDVSADLVQADKQHRPKQLGLRVAYNLLG